MYAMVKHGCQHLDHDQPLITMVGNVCFGEHG